MHLCLERPVICLLRQINPDHAGLASLFYFIFYYDPIYAFISNPVALDFIAIFTKMYQTRIS
jgi:hypothetical protein